MVGIGHRLLRAPLSRVVATSAVLCTLTWSSAANASNSTRPRTAPRFPADPCLLEVDRTSNPQIDVAVDLPYEDVTLTDDEVEDSRTVRLIAACRSPTRTESMPNWIHGSDIERSRAAGVIDEVPPDEDVVETSTAWSDCIFEVSEPHRLSCEDAGSGIRIDTSGLPAGVYELWGYTFEPPLNLWTRRPGLLVVRDGVGDDPGAAINSVSRPTDAWPPEYTAVGCAASASQLTIWWIDANSSQASSADAWTRLEPRELTSPGPFEFDFTLPVEALDKGIILRYAADAGEQTWLGEVESLLVTVPSSPGVLPASESGVCSGRDSEMELETRPGCAFSSAEHPTTALLILLLISLPARSRHHS